MSNQINMNDSRQPIYFRGLTTAVSALATSRPGDNFFSSKGSKTLPRLPRLGAKTEDTPVFYPGTQLRHLIREAFLSISIKANRGKPIPLESHFMLIQGVPIGRLARELNNEKMEGVIEREDGLRRVNPLISLGGFWKFAGTLGVDDWLPLYEGEKPIHYVHSKMRSMPHQRNPELVSELTETDVERLKWIMVEDGNIARQASELDSQVKALKKIYREASKAEKQRLGSEISVLEERKKELKEGKQGSTETLMRPVEGYEAIVPGTEFTSGMNIDRCSELELGFVLYALREIAKKPFVGAHFADAKGEFKLDWKVSTWGKNRPAPEVLGIVKLGLLHFEIIDENDERSLTSALSLAEEAIKFPRDFGLNFSEFSPSYSGA